LNKKVLLTSLLPAFFLFSTLGMMSSAPNPPVEWTDALLYNFGDIQHEKPVEVVFAFKNRSSDSLHIDNVRTSCGCTSPNWLDIAVAPDSIGYIQVEYDAKDLGYFSKWIKVYFNGYRKGERLEIEGYVVE